MPLPFVQPDERTRSYYSGSTGPVKQMHVGTIVFDPVDYASYALAGFSQVSKKVAVAGDPTIRSVSLETGKYWPPFNVTVRTSLNWELDIEGEFVNSNWVFVLPDELHDNEFKMKFLLDGGWMEGDDLLVPAGQPHKHFTEREVFFAYRISFHTNKWSPNHLVTLRNSDDGWNRDVYGTFRNGAWQFLLDRADYCHGFKATLVLNRKAFMTEEHLHVTPNAPVHEVSDRTIHFDADENSEYRHGYDNFLSIESPLEQFTVGAIGSEAEEYDVIIVGSGMGGGVLADALSENGVRTLVLDAGGLWFPVHMCELPSSEVDLPERDAIGHYKTVGDTKLSKGVHFNLGGRSVYWSGVIPRMRQWEMRDIWPESVRLYLTEPDPYGVSGYDKAEKLMRKGKTLGPFQDKVREHLKAALHDKFNVIDLPRSLHQSYVDHEGNVENVLQKPTGVFSTTDLLLDSLGYRGKTGRTNLRVNLHHLATRIEHSGSMATEVVCQDLVGGVERHYYGKYVVLACGSIESAKLALSSELNDPSDPTEKMGYGLTDHPTYFYQIHHELPKEGPLGWIGDSRGHAKLLLQHKAATPTAHAYNVELLINSKYWDARHADDDMWEVLIESQKTSKVELQFKFDSNLNLNNYVQLTAPGQKPNVRVSPNPPTSAFNEEIVEFRNRILTALGVTGFSTYWKPEEWVDGKEGTVHHAGGTLRMSADGSGVVDENLKFRKFDNLYCCDGSVFPTIPAANPSLTLVALALRLANTLAARLGKQAAEGGGLVWQ